MNSSASQRMTKSQVCKYLGKSKRTIEGYVVRGHLNVSYAQGPNGHVAIFDRGEVRQFKTELAERGSYQSLLAARGEVTPATVAMMDRRRPPKLLAAPSPEPAPARAIAAASETLGTYATLDEAAKFSNLPRAWLIRQARAGVPWAVNVSGSDKREVWRFRLQGSGIVRES